MKKGQGSKVMEILRRLEKEYPAPKTALNYSNPFELLVATILSAQTTDAHVNKVTSALFKKYRKITDYIDTPLETLQKDLSSVNFYNNKAKNIRNCAGIIVETHGSEVPKTMEELTALPGVARKTANIVLSHAYGIHEGIAVDTHVRRVSGLLGLTKHEDPVKIERDLMDITPREEWEKVSLLLILHGRKVCVARRPKHAECVLFDLCPSRDI